MISIISRFALNGYLDEAEKLMQLMLNSMRDFPRNAEGLYALAKYYIGKNKEKALQYRELLLELYPDSDEAKQLSSSKP